MKPNILIILTLLAGLVSSCVGKDKRCVFSEEQKKVIQYEKGKVISFIDETGLPVDAVVIKSEIFLSKEREGGFFGKNIILNHKKATLTIEAFDLDIELGFNCNECPYSESYGCSLMISEQKYRSWSFGFELDAKGNFLINNSTAFHNSLEINGKVYYDVVEGNRLLQTLDKPDINWQLFYNKEYGILQIKIDGKDYLTIKN